MKKVKHLEFQTWDGLNEAIMQTTDEKYLQTLLNRERSGRARQQFMRRIHSRLNKVRADRERQEFNS